MTSITACIVAYETEPAKLVAAIRSVLSSPMRIACTVVDNSPTPELMRCVEEAGAKYIFAGKNLGFGAGHNLGFRSEGEGSKYHLALNPDVHFTPEVIGVLQHFMEEHERVGWVMPKVLNADGTEQRLCKQLPSPMDLLSRRFLGNVGTAVFAEQQDRYELKNLDLGVAREIPCLSGCFMFLRSAVIREVGFFDERYFMYMEDVDLCRRIGSRYQTVFYPDVAVTHGYAKGSYSSSRLLTYHVQSAIRYFGKWGWLWDAGRRVINKKTHAIQRQRGVRESAA